MDQLEISSDYPAIKSELHVLSVPLILPVALDSAIYAVRTHGLKRNTCHWTWFIDSFAINLESSKKNPEISGESLSEELANEIVPGSTNRPVRPPLKVTTPTVSVTQRPTITTSSTITKQPTTTRPIVVTQRPTMKKPTVVTQGLIVVTSRPPLFLATFGNNITVDAVRKDFVCQVGRGACRAVFKGTAWNFRPQPFSMNQSKYFHVSVLYVICLHMGAYFDNSAIWKLLVDSMSALTSVMH